MEREPIEAQSKDPSLKEGESSRARPKMNRFALSCAILASTNSILLGYDIGVMSGAVLYIRENLKISSTQEEILVGSLNVCSLIGSLVSGKTSDYIGRRYTIVLAAATFFIGALLMGFAPSYPFLMAGRVIAGIGVGYSLMISPVYTSELSPAMTRGLLSSFPEVFCTVGILLGYIFNYALAPLPHDINWRLMIGLAALPAIYIALRVIFMPESPRWLVMKGRLGEARRVLIRTSETADEADSRLREIIHAASVISSGSNVSRETSSLEAELQPRKIARDCASGPCASHEASHPLPPGNWHGQGVWRELLWRPSRPTRRILTAAIGINFFMQASGNDAVIYYLPEVFKDAGIQNKNLLFGINVIMGTAKAAFALVSALCLDKYGRRPLLLLGTSGMTAALTVLGLASKFLEHSARKQTWAIVLSIIAVCADVSFFSIGLGPITWVYSSEIFPLRLRAQGTSLAIGVNRLVSGVVAMTFLSITEKITFGGVFFMLAGIMAVGTVFFYFLLPETKGKSLEEIGALFEDDKKISAEMSGS
ncbi:hypothetical protein Ancab_016799 [Ancistrocladus abbreviatus]